MDNDLAQQAKDKLELAIKEYFQATDPESFITAYALVAQKESVERFAQGLTTVGYLVPTDQSWPLTVGLLMTASDMARGGGV